MKTSFSNKQKFFKADKGYCINFGYLYYKKKIQCIVAIICLLVKTGLDILRFINSRAVNKKRIIFKPVYLIMLLVIKSIFYY